MAIGTGSVLPVTVTEGLLHQFKAWVIAGAALPSVGTAVGFRQTIVSPGHNTSRGWAVGTPAVATGITASSGQTDTPAIAHGS